MNNFKIQRRTLCISKCTAFALYTGYNTPIAMIKPFYKPVGMSSYDVIRHIKKKYPGQKIGHGGTLDPLAEGVLVIAIGRDGTKKLQEVLKGTNKSYIATIELGAVSETDDSEGPIVTTGPQKKPTHERIQEILNAFRGETMQTPPKYSAIKIDGVPAYKRARRGETFTLPQKKVTIYEMKLISYNYPQLTVEMTVSSGFYVRSFARDFGEKLTTGAYMSALLRTAVGSFKIDDAEHLDRK